MFNEEKFLSLVESHDEAIVLKMLWRKKNRSWVEKSQQIGFAKLKKAHLDSLSHKDISYLPSVGGGKKVH